MENLIIKKLNKKRSDTTITIKVTAEFRDKWDKFCIDNSVNKKETLMNVLNKIMRG